MADELDRVVPLDELDDFKVAEGDPDVRGWDVLSADGRKIGEVENLLIDTAAMKVRYLEVDVDRDVLDASEERHILVPIGYARLDENDDQVRVDSLMTADVMALPEYRRDALTREYETSVRKQFDSGFAPTSAETDLYGGAGYDARTFYGSRRTGAAGETRENITTRPGEVVGERQPAASGMSAKPRSDEEIRREGTDIRGEGDLRARDEGDSGRAR